MKHLNLLLSAATVVALTLPPIAQSQTFLDLLKTIQPGQPAPAQPAPPPTVVTNPQTYIIYSNAPSPTTQAAPIPPPAVLDTRPAFMAFVTNSVLVTNRVVVTNYVVATNAYVTTNFYNAQGQYLQPAAPPPIPGLVPISPLGPGAPKPPVVPDPKVVLAGQQEAVKDLLTQSAVAASKRLSANGSFNDPAHQIQIPEGLTVLDRAKANRLVTAMNATAEKAVPETTQLMQTAISRLIIPDPAAILRGGTDAATNVPSKGTNAVPARATQRDSESDLQCGTVGNSGQPAKRERAADHAARGGGDTL